MIYKSINQSVDKLNLVLYYPRMSNPRRQTYCVICGKENRKIRIGGNIDEEATETDCKNCNSLTGVSFIGSGLDQGKIEIEDHRKSGESIYCPSCGTYGLRLINQKDDNLYTCVNCKRVFELEYS